MRCLCCNKELLPSDKYGWHKVCIKNFFGSNKIPELDLTEEKLEEIKKNNISLGYTVPGVQKKLSVSLSSKQNIKK